MARRDKIGQKRIDVRRGGEPVEHFLRRFRLLVDLLEHEVFIAALFGSIHSFRESLRFAIDCRSVLDATDLEPVVIQRHHLPVTHADDSIGQRENRRKIG